MSGHAIEDLADRAARLESLIDGLAILQDDTRRNLFRPPAPYDRMQLHSFNAVSALTATIADQAAALARDLDKLDRPATAADALETLAHGGARRRAAATRPEPE